MSAWVVTLISIAALATGIYFIISSGKDYSQERAESEAEDYAGIIEEARGPVTWFLWLSYAAIFIWTIYYFVAHGSEFSVLFGG